jgi:hypothetical protein
VLKAQTTAGTWACAADNNNTYTVNDGALTIKNSAGTTIGTFTANQSGGTTVTLPADANTTYAAGTGLTLSGTTFAANGLTTTACTAAQKLTWNGTNFSCATDLNTVPNNAKLTLQINGNNVTGNDAYTADSSTNTVYNIPLGAGLKWDTTTSKIAINAPACGSAHALTWNGTAFSCIASTTTTGSITPATGWMYSDPADTTVYNTNIIRKTGSVCHLELTLKRSGADITVNGNGHMTNTTIATMPTSASFVAVGTELFSARQMIPGGADYALMGFNSSGTDGIMLTNGAPNINIHTGDGVQIRSTYYCPND